MRDPTPLAPGARDAAGEADGGQPLVSVVTIFLNAEQFFEEAVESVIAQTYDRWELLLIDDGSTDASSTIARRYAQEHPERIRYLEHPGHANRGMSASRNLGIAHARGAHIAFLDADDVYLPEKLERQVRLLTAHPDVDMVYGATRHWYSWTGRPEDVARDQVRRLGVPPGTIVRPPRLIPLFLRLEAQTPGTCGVLVRRRAALGCGGFEEQFRGMFEDQVFFYKLCLRAPVLIDGEPLDLYRQHPASHSSIKRSTGEYRGTRAPNRAYGAFLKWLEAHLRREGVVDEEVWHALQSELGPYHNPLLYSFRLAAYYFEGARRTARAFLTR